MPRVFLSRRAFEDVQRLADFLAENDERVARETLELIRSAVAPLEQHPFLGRPAEHGLRELVISRGKTGYVGLYEVDERKDRVIVHAVRHQREAGFSR
jgi:addiction module RelE/StbE family toxin